jgi:hypothetical protein
MADERRNPRETPDDEVPDRAGRGLDDMEVRQGGHSLKDRETSQVRDAQRGGTGAPVERGAPEPNETLRTVWSEPGGEASNYRNAMIGAGGKADDHSDETAAESPDTDRHLSDATLGPEDKDATAEAIERMRSGGGRP